MSTNSLKSHVLGYPRIGANRELKRAVESYWKGTITESDLLKTASELKQKNWQTQKDAGLSHVTTGDFSFYDNVLDTAIMLGAVPPRFSADSHETELELYFQMARGDIKRNIPPMAMTKWFDTNYHYIVPEFTPGLQLTHNAHKIVEETKEAIKLGFLPKPVILGPITFLSLSKDYDNADRWSNIFEVVRIYREILTELEQLLPDGADWIQIDEPILATDLSTEAYDAFVKTYSNLNVGRKAKLLLTTYFGSIEDNLDLALSSGCAGLHVDLVRGEEQLDRLPDFIVVEGPLAGGHLGFGDDWADFTLKEIVADVLNNLEKECLNIPVIPAGGIFDAEDALFFLKMGAAAVQVATRFAVAKESGLTDTAKQSFFEAEENDVFVSGVSPTGYPIRLLRSSPCLNSNIVPQCTPLGYAMDSKGRCQYIDAYNATGLSETGKKLSVVEKVCLCHHIGRYDTWTCGSNVVRLKETTSKDAEGMYVQPTTEQIILEYLGERPFCQTEPKRKMVEV